MAKCLQISSGEPVDSSAVSFVCQARLMTEISY